jgi:cobalamin biosynthesis Mg chelatase CobN
LNARHTQSEIDAIKNELVSLKSALVIREDKQELYNTLTEIAQMDISGYSKDKQEAFVSAYNSAMETLNSLDSTEEQVSSAKQSIQEAKTNLESKDGMHWALWVLLIILAIVGVILLICWIYFGFVEGDWDMEAYPWIEFAIGLILLVGSVLIMIFCG